MWPYYVRRITFCSIDSVEGNPTTPPPVVIPARTVGTLLVMVSAPASGLTCGQAHIGKVLITPSGGLATTTVSINVTIVCQGTGKGTDARAGKDDVWGLGRMAWLNSVRGVNNSRVTRPYTAITLTRDATAAGGGKCSFCLGCVPSSR